MLDINLRGNLRAFRAAAYGILLTLTFPLQAQSIFITEQRVEADVKVYVTKHRSDADLIVFKATYQFDAKGNEGRWYFVDYEFESDKIIHFVKYRSDSDVKIYYSPYKTDAKWRNSEKKKLFH